LCLCLRQGRFHGEIRILAFALVLASLVKTRLNYKATSPLGGFLFYESNESMSYESRVNEP